MLRFSRRFVSHLCGSHSIVESKSGEFHARRKADLQSYTHSPEFESCSGQREHLLMLAAECRSIPPYC